MAPSSSNVRTRRGFSGLAPVRHTLYPSGKGVPLQSSKDEEGTLQDCVAAYYWDIMDSKLEGSLRGEYERGRGGQGNCEFKNPSILSLLPCSYVATC